MGVSSQRGSEAAREPRGARARTRKLMLETATALMQSGITPSVSDVAEAAAVSRATAYRYFPSQAALVQTVVEEALGPILTWKSDETDAAARVRSLLALAMPRIIEFESTFKAALKLSLDQWARRQAGTLGEEPPFRRGKRVDLLQQAIEPLRGRLGEAAFRRLAKALSLIFGIEVLVVLKDLWGSDPEEVLEIAAWAATALVAAAMTGGTRETPAGNSSEGAAFSNRNASMLA